MTDVRTEHRPPGRRALAGLGGLRAWLPALPFALLALIAVVGPFLVPMDPERVVAPASLPPGGAHVFGTDSTGMDVFSRTVAAARTNVVMGVLVAMFATTAGLLLGLVIGMSESERSLGGLLGRGASRVVDLSDAVPALIVAIVVVGLFGPSVWSISIALAIFLMPNQIRLTRAEVLKVRHDAYLDAARMAGMSEAHVLRRHVLPNACRPALENSSLIFGVSIVVAAGLGLLGVGLAPPTPEWGSMISSGISDVMMGRWWSTLFPAAALCLAVASASSASGALTRLTRGGSSHH